jgi:hypothetical protein
MSGGMENDLYYLRAIARRLDEFAEAVDPHGEGTCMMGYEALHDERDWLGCYIDRMERTTSNHRRKLD